MISQIILLALVAIVAYYYLFGKRKYNLPPGPTGIPIIGNAFAVSGRPYQTYTKWREEYGDIFYIRFGPIRVVVLGNVQIIKECFNEPVFNGRSGQMLLCYLSQGKNGIVASEGQVWMEQRRFTLRHLRDFGFGKNLMENIIMEEVNEFNSWLKSEEGKPVLINGGRFELPVLNSLWVILAGNKFCHDDTEKLEMLQKLDQFAKASLCGILNLLAPAVLDMAPELLGKNHFTRIGEDFRKMLKEIIKEHEDTLPEEDSPRDFIDAYLHEIRKTEDPNSSFYKDVGVRSLLSVIGDMFFAGAETSSSTLAWSVLYLALNPNIQKKMQDEIDEVVGKSRKVSLNDKPNLPYAEATLQEILRKSSLVVTGVMHTAREDAKFGGYDIPKDTWIMPNIYAIHHDPTIWGDPHNFRPERFLSPDGKTVVKSENLLPFSLGKRICLGETLARDEIFLFLTNMFQRFSITVDPTKPKPNYEAKVGFLLHPEDFHVIVQERSE